MWDGVVTVDTILALWSRSRYQAHTSYLCHSLPRPSHGSPPVVENEECAQRLIWCRSHATEFRRDKYFASLRHGSAASHLPLYPRWGRGWGHSPYSAPGWSLQIDTEECCDVLHACISRYLDIYRYSRYTFWQGHCCCCRQLCGKWAGGLNDPVPATTGR